MGPLASIDAHIEKGDVVPLLDLFWAMLWFFLFFAWIWLLISIFADIFRSDDLSGWAKAFWTIFVVVLPWLGVLVYLIARGGSMQERAMADVAAREKATRQYIQEVSGGGASAADELEKLGRLRDQGVITADEFDVQKAKLLA
ncbi:MAG TPA: SHOCT domain-containing protein [Acidimicrobiia bacterium]|nr:SHOCT domain-containing protein [Acidimicrobiia bacterium]